MAVAALAALAMGSMEARAADYGLGVSVQSNDSIIYAPVEFNGKVRLEPSIRYRKDELTRPFGGEIEQRQLELGIGLFGLGAINKSVRFYYGGRVSYIDLKSTTPAFASPTLFPATTTDDADGYRISPTIGFELLFNERLSLAGEAEYFYQDISSDGDFERDTESSGTDTRLILRFKF